MCRRTDAEADPFLGILRSEAMLLGKSMGVDSRLLASILNVSVSAHGHVYLLLPAS